MKFMWRIVVSGLLLGLAAALSGCSGINASGSVSPATFLLPGVMDSRPVQVRPADPEAPTAPMTAVSLKLRN